MPKYTRNRLSRGKRILLVIGIIMVLILLFLASFWITSYTLKSNQEPNEVQSAQATPKPTKKQLEQMVIEKDEKITELEAELERYRSATGAPTVTATTRPSATARPSVTTQAPQPTTPPTTRPAAQSTPRPTPVPTPPPTAAPTQAPTAAPTLPPTAAPTQTQPEAPALTPQAPNAAVSEGTGE